MDSISQDDNGGGRKMGLARLAKTRSLSSSLNSLPMEGKPEEKDDINNVHDTERSLDPSYDVQASPLRSLTKQNATVNLLPNKMNVSELSGQQACDRKGKGVNMEEDLVSLDSVGHTHVPCSDPDFIRNAKSGIRVNQCNSVTNQRDAAGSNEQQGDKSVSATDKDSPKIKRESTSSVTPKLSPLLSRRSRLAPPQIKRSSSMTRLTEAINQIHNLCVFPAQPVVVEQTCEGLSERTSHTSPSVQQPMSEEQGFSSRSASWYGYKKTSVSSEGSEGGHEDHNLAESPLHTCRSASLDELNNIDHSYGLPIISPVDAKKKNYLFGGLSSLLGASELDRYFPTRSINIFIATWNMNGKEPPMNLEAFLLPEEMDHMPDMFVVGTQESGGSRSEWEVRLQATIGPSHVLFTSAIFGVLHLTIFLRRDLLWFCSVPEEATYSLRPGIAYKTKGGVGIGFQFFGTRILFINSHLTAHEEKQALRIQNFRNITRSLDLPRLLPHKHKHKDVTHRYDSVFWLGDLNFRLAVNRDHVFERLKKAGPETYQHLLQWDQLSQARHKVKPSVNLRKAQLPLLQHSSMTLVLTIMTHLPSSVFHHILTGYCLRVIEELLHAIAMIPAHCSKHQTISLS
ncbi:hypothetical protein OTU49_004401 [Cherax quadricarinatus]|uniref:Inositol polyphosphate-related phosphatase domain-containing protein n=3 Tax=Cherax quadricarinatus TaxID=27406 RepID=A0AAW0XC14_CHEQU